YGRPGASAGRGGDRLHLHRRARPIVFLDLKRDVDVRIRERVLKDTPSDGEGFLGVERGGGGVRPHQRRPISFLPSPNGANGPQTPPIRPGLQPSSQAVRISTGSSFPAACAQ